MTLSERVNPMALGEESAQRVGEKSPLTLQIPLVRLEGWGMALLLAWAILFNALQLYPEVTVEAPYLNDNVLHLLNIRRAAEAMSQWQDPTDPWLSQIGQGYPLFHHYQHLSYQLPGLAVALSGGAISPDAALRWTTFLLLCLLPLPLYWSARHLGLDRLAALLAAVVGPLLATRGLYGLDALSFVWSGFGLYTRLWAAWLFPLALAQAYTTINTNRGYLASVALVAGLLLSHLIYGYILMLSLAALAVLNAWRLGQPNNLSPGIALVRQAQRLLAVSLLALVVSAYALVPLVLDLVYTNPAVGELPWQYDSAGASWVLMTLVKGELFDAGRFGSLTLLAGVGMASCLWRWRQAPCRNLAALALFWLLLFFGRPTWGALLDLLPMSHAMDFHRRVSAVHLGGIYLMGLGLAWPWRVAWSRANRLYLLIPAALTVALLLPVYRERVAYYGQNAAWMRETADAVAAERADLDALVEAIQELPPGRVYAGLPARWGGEIKVGAVPLYAYLAGRGLETLGFSYHALSLNAGPLMLFDDGLLEQYQLFNVRYVVTPQGWTVPAYYTAVGDYGRFRLYEVPTGGYFDLVDSDMAFVGGKGDFYAAASTWLTSELLRAKQHPTIALGEAPLGYPALYPLDEAAAEIPLMAVPPSSYGGEVLSEEAGSNWYAATVAVERESWLMLKVTYHPGWRAYVDGERAETAMLMPSYVGVRLPPGQHEVRLVYSGGAGRVALMGLGVLTLVLLWWTARRPDLTARLRERLWGKPRHKHRRR